MNTQYRRIAVPLGRDEWEALRMLSETQYRHPRDQARVMLRQALGLVEKREGVGLVSQTGPTPSHSHQ